MSSQKDVSKPADICKDPLSISIRAFVPPTDKANNHKRRSSKLKQGPPEYTLVFDTETTVDERQAMKLGTWHFYKGAELVSEGAFFDAQELTEEDQRTLLAWARHRGITVITKETFVVDVFYR